MSTTTTYGYKLPSTGERGTWWTNLTDNFSRLDSHSHNGIDSPLLPTTSLAKTTQTILSANWSAVSGQPGTYSQTVTVPAGYDMASIAIKFYFSGGSQDGAEVIPSIEKVSATSFKIYINDNTQTLKAIYA